MKLNVISAGRSFNVEVRRRLTDDPTIRAITIDNGEQTSELTVEILSRCKDRLTLRIGQMIMDALILRTEDSFSIGLGEWTIPTRVSSPRALKKVDGTDLQDSGPVRLTAHMPGKVVDVLAAQGDTVGEGQGLVIIEAMKMQNEITSPRSGEVLRCGVSTGITVNAGDLLFEIA